MLKTYKWYFCPYRLPLLYTDQYYYSVYMYTVCVIHVYLCSKRCISYCICVPNASQEPSYPPSKPLSIHAVWAGWETLSRMVSSHPPPTCDPSELHTTTLTASLHLMHWTVLHAIMHYSLSLSAQLLNIQTHSCYSAYSQNIQPAFYTLPSLSIIFILHCP